MACECGWRSSTARTHHIRGGKESTLTPLTQADTNVVATQTQEGQFSGTFTLKNGTVKEVTVRRVSDNELQAILKSTPKRIAMNVRPAVDVPQSCAVFFGGWSGRFNIDQGEQRLLVVDIKADCSAKYSYRTTTSNAAPSAFRDAEIKSGTLSIPCGNDGTCRFESRGDESWVSYSTPHGGRNSGVFKKQR